VNPDNSFDARFSAPPAVGDHFTLKRNGELIGEVIIKTVKTPEASGAPTEGFLGKVKIGDELTRDPLRPSRGPGGWILWCSPEGAFRILAPSHHETRVRSEKRGPITVQEHVDMFIDDAQKQTYMVLWFEVPDDFLSNPEYAKESESVKEDLKKHDFTIVSRKSIAYEGMEGLEEDVTLTDIFARQRVFLTSRRMYQLLAISAYREVPVRARQFFGSFNLYEAAGRPLKAGPGRAIRDGRMSLTDDKGVSP
jgi:hypothetical protein